MLESQPRALKAGIMASFAKKLESKIGFLALVPRAG